VIHGLFTGRLPLVAGWLVGFVAQGMHRSWALGIPWTVPLVPMTSAAFVVFTLYMIPDPATTPLGRWRQFAFGFAVAVAYSVLLWLHLVFGLMFALLIVSACRGAGLYAAAVFRRAASPAATPVVPRQPAPATLAS
jgi:hypothetical protein